MASPEDALRRAFGSGQVHLVTGHHQFGVHRLLRTPCKYFSFVRDPIERAMSEYFYAFSYKEHRLRERILSGQLSVGEFLETFPGDAQAVQLGGDARVEGVSWQDQACINMKESLIFTGVNESFNLSVLILARRMGWKVPLYVPANVTKLSDEQREWRTAAKVEAKARRDRFAADYAVYDSAVAELAAIRAEGGAELAAVEAAFERLLGRLNESALASIHRLYNFDRDDELPPEADAIMRSTDYQLVDAYLRQPRLALPRLNLVGVVDAIMPSLISGWAFNLTTTEPLQLELRVDGRVMGQTLANRPRTDVQNVGWGRVECGFDFHLPEPLNRAAQIEVRVAGGQTRVRLGAPTA